MLYKFKSQATADLILLEVNARELLDIIGKSATPQGIVTAAQVPAAVAALRAAIALQEAAPTQWVDSDAHDAHDKHSDIGVSLRQRAAPFIELLLRSAAAHKDVVWGR